MGSKPGRTTLRGRRTGEFPQQRARPAKGRPVPVARSEDLARLRARMDALNGRLLTLIERRVAFARRIGRAKQALGLAGADPARERAMLAALLGAARGGIPRVDLERIFRAVFGASRRAVQRDGRGGRGNRR